MASRNVLLVLAITLSALPVSISIKSTVLYGYEVQPLQYSGQDGAMWNSSNATERLRFSDNRYGGQRSATGYLTGGLGRLSDGIQTGSITQGIWVQWQRPEIHLIFDFHQNVSLCQIDIHAEGPTLGNAQFDAYYAQDLPPDIRWGTGTQGSVDKTEATVSLPRQSPTGSVRGPSRSSTRIEIFIIVNFGRVQPFAISEVAFWECSCPKTQVATTCARQTNLQPQLPCAGASCPGEPSAHCYNNYCGQQSTRDCSATFISSSSSSKLARCSTATSAAPTTTAAAATAPVSVHSGDRGVSQDAGSRHSTTKQAGATTAKDDTHIYLVVIGTLGGVLVIIVILLLIRAGQFHRAKKQHLKITAAAIMDDGQYSAATLSRHFANNAAFGFHNDRQSRCSGSSNNSPRESPNLSPCGQERCYKSPRVGVNGQPVLATYSIPRAHAPHTHTPSMLSAASSSSQIAPNLTDSRVYRGDATQTKRPISSPDLNDEYMPMSNDGCASPKSADSYETMSAPHSEEIPRFAAGGTSINEMKPTPPSSTQDSSSEGGNENIVRHQK
eukprot:scpid6093/ scgid25234/ 